jgi:hypothetical protein
MKRLLFILCLLAAFQQSRGQTVDTNLIVEVFAKGGPDYYSRTNERPTDLVGTGAWSEPVTDTQGHSLRGRLLVYWGTNITGRDVWTTAPTYLEIQDVTAANQRPTRIYFDMMEGLTFELRDATGAPAVNLPHRGFRGGVPPPYWATVPARGLLRVRADAGSGISGGNDAELRLVFLDMKGHVSNTSWTIPAGDTNNWFLSATLLPPPATNTAYNSDVWQGMLALPAVKLSVVKH